LFPLIDVPRQEWEVKRLDWVESGEWEMINFVDDTI
jgi:hypothetical protein